MGLRASVDDGHDTGGREVTLVGVAGKFHQIEARRDEIVLVVGAIPGLGKAADGAVVRPASNRT